MHDTFTLFGVIYDADTGQEVGRLPARPEYTGRWRKPDVDLLARLNVQAEMLAETQRKIAVLEDPDRWFPRHPEDGVHGIVDEDETPWDREARRRLRDGERHILHHLGFDAWAKDVQRRVAHRNQLREDALSYPLPCVDPEDTRSPEPFGVVYETTDDTSLARIDSFVWLRLDARGDVEFASLEQQARPSTQMMPGRRRTFAKDMAQVPLYFDPTWESDETPLVTEDERAADLSILADLHRFDVEAAAQDRRRREDAADVARIQIPGVAAPASRAEFDWERQMSNRDAAVRLAVTGGRKRWLVQDRAFPGEQAMGLWADLRLRDGEAVSDPQVWASSLRSRFNVRRYIDAITAAFDDNPEHTFRTVESWRLAKVPRGEQGTVRTASWAEVEAWLSEIYTEFRERCFLDCVGEDVGDGAWMQSTSVEVDPDDPEENGLSYEDLHGFHGVRVDLGHALYQVDLVSKTPPTRYVRSKSEYKTAPRPTTVRKTKPSERGVFTSEELVRGLLATVRRMP